MLYTRSGLLYTRSGWFGIAAFASGTGGDVDVGSGTESVSAILPFVPSNLLSHSLTTMRFQIANMFLFVVNKTGTPQKH